MSLEIICNSLEADMSCLVGRNGSDTFVPLAIAGKAVAVQHLWGIFLCHAQAKDSIADPRSPRRLTSSILVTEKMDIFMTLSLPISPSQDDLAKLPADWADIVTARPGARHFCALKIGNRALPCGVLVLATDGPLKPVTWTPTVLRGLAAWLMVLMQLPQIIQCVQMVADIVASRSLDELVQTVARGATSFVAAVTYSKPNIKAALVREDQQAAAIFEEKSKSTCTKQALQHYSHSQAPSPAIAITPGQRLSCEEQSALALLEGALGSQRGVGSPSAAGAVLGGHHAPLAGSQYSLRQPGGGMGGTTGTTGTYQSFVSDGSFRSVGGNMIQELAIPAMKGHSLMLRNTLLGEVLESGKTSFTIPDLSAFMQASKLYPQDLGILAKADAVTSVGVVAPVRRSAPPSSAHPLMPGFSSYKSINTGPFPNSPFSTISHGNTSIGTVGPAFHTPSISSYAGGNAAGARQSSNYNYSVGTHATTACTGGHHTATTTTGTTHLSMGHNGLPPGLGGLFALFCTYSGQPQPALLSAAVNELEMLLSLLSPALDLRLNVDMADEWALLCVEALDPAMLARASRLGARPGSAASSYAATRSNPQQGNSIAALLMPSGVPNTSAGPVAGHGNAAAHGAGAANHPANSLLMQGHVGVGGNLRPASAGPRTVSNLVNTSGQGQGHVLSGSQNNWRSVGSSTVQGPEGGGPGSRILGSGLQGTVDSMYCSLDVVPASRRNLNQMSPLLSGVHDHVKTLQAQRMLKLSASLHADELAAVSVHEKIGAGGYGEVFRGTYHGAEVAVKVITQKANNGKAANGPDGEHSSDEMLSGSGMLHRMLDAFELAISTSVQHNNIVQVLACFSDVAVEKVPIRTPRVPGTPTNTAVAMDFYTVLIPLDKAEELAFEAESAQSGKSLYSSSPVNQSRLAQPCRTSQPPPKPVPALVILQEFCDCGSLSEALKKNTLLMPDGRGKMMPNYKVIYSTLLEVALALRHLHALKLVHCDLKPGNVLLKSAHRDPRGWQAKLSDFGLAKVLEEQEDGTLALPAWHAHGTATHMAPELLAGETGLGPEIDIYAFGVIMYQCVSCSRSVYPFLTPELIMQRVVYTNMRPVMPNPCRLEYKALASACWAKDKTTRPTAEELVRQLTVLRQDAHRVARAASNADLASSQEHSSRHQPKRCTTNSSLGTAQQQNAPVARKSSSNLSVQGTGTANAEAGAGAGPRGVAAAAGANAGGAGQRDINLGSPVVGSPVGVGSSYSSYSNTPPQTSYSNNTTPPSSHHGPIVAGSGGAGRGQSLPNNLLIQTQQQLQPRGSSGGRPQGQHAVQQGQQPWTNVPDSGISGIPSDQNIHSSSTVMAGTEDDDHMNTFGTRPVQLLTRRPQQQPQQPHVVGPVVGPAAAAVPPAAGRTSPLRARDRLTGPASQRRPQSQALFHMRVSDAGAKQEQDPAQAQGPAQLQAQAQGQGQGQRLVSTSVCTSPDTSQVEEGEHKTPSHGQESMKAFGVFSLLGGVESSAQYADAHSNPTHVHDHNAIDGLGQGGVLVDSAANAVDGSLSLFMPAPINGPVPGSLDAAGQAQHGLIPPMMGRISLGQALRDAGVQDLASDALISPTGTRPARAFNHSMV